MFDHHHYHEGGRSSVSVNVTEKRAPTDESVRLLREMESAAEAKITGAIRVQDTSFEGVVHVMRDLINLRILLAATFSLNGKKLTVKTHVDESNCNVDAAIDALVKAVSERIAVEIICPCFTRDLRQQLRI